MRQAHNLSTEEVLERVDALGSYAVAIIPSRLSDERVERLLMERGKQEMGSLPLPAPAKTGRRKILHVSTELFPVGGHTRVLANWITLDKGSDHAVALTCQCQPTPGWFAQLMTATGGELLELEVACSKLERSKKLRRFAADRQFTHIILHHFAGDSIPVLAFATDGGPPVLIYNHADQFFWNGSSVADAVIDYCPASMGISRRNRGARRAHYLPLVVGDAPPFVGRAEAKQRLGFSPDTLLLVSIGRKPKYLPWRHYDFFSTYGKLLGLVPQAKMVVIGVSDADRGELGIEVKPPNLILAGQVIDPSLYAMAADMYVECFPVGAGLGACDMGRYGAAPLLAYGNGLSIDGTLSRGVLEGCPLPPHPQTEAEQLKLALQLCRNEPERRSFGEAFATYINARSVGKNWLVYLENIYRATEGLKHEVAPDGDREPLPPSSRVDFNAYTYKTAGFIYHTALAEMRHRPHLMRFLRAVVFQLAKYRIARRLFRNAPGLFGFVAKS